MSKRLDHKRCLIVGGTSGIGLATARRFVDEGAQVVVAGLPAQEGVEGLAFCPCDVRSGEQVDALFADVQRRLGGLDVLFHVAGGSGRRQGDGSLHECSDAGWNATLELNLSGVFHTNRAAVRRFLAQKTGGVILNMGSVLALAPAPRYFDTVAYAASKGAILAMSRLAAARYASDGIRVNVLAPAVIDTPMAQRAVNDPAIREFLQTKQPLGPGPGRPEDCAEAAVFLCSDESRLITGAVLPIDGGWLVA